MATLSSSSSRCSSSSFHRSSRYSTSTVKSFSADSVHPRLHGQFGEISSITNGFKAEPESFTSYHGDSRDETFGGFQGDGESFLGYQGDQGSFGGYRGERSTEGNLGLGDSKGSVGVVRAVGDRYFLSADVSGFEPQEVVVVAYNRCVVIHAEKTGGDGGLSGKITHKSLLPADMDPLSVSSTLTEGMLLISVGRILKLPVTPVFCSEAQIGPLTLCNL